MWGEEMDRGVFEGAKLSQEAEPGSSEEPQCLYNIHVFLSKIPK
jgi:hypothetical protein